MTVRPATPSDAAALAEVAGHIDVLANAEDLPGHAAAVRVRQRS